MSRKGVPNKISKKIVFICGICNKHWLDYPSRIGRKKFCSKKCAALNKPQLYKKGNTINLGKTYTYERKQKISQSNKKAWSNPSLRRIVSLQRKGKNNPNWSKKPKYSGIHKWLVREYGNANNCESITCDKKSIFYQWAKIKDKLYERKRGNFMMLCVGCHLRYDRHDLPREQK